MLRFKTVNFKPKKKAFTLIELLVYSGIVVVSVGLITGIVYTISRANTKTQAEEELNNQLVRFEEMFRQSIESAKGINSIDGSYLNLEEGNSEKNPTVFSLNDDIVTMQEGSSSQLALNNSNKVKVTALSFTPTGSPLSDISTVNHYAWSENVGWIDFAYPGSNVQVPRGEGDLQGLAYVLSDGSWISLNCESTDSCSTVDYKVSADIDGNLSGWAWSESFGWLSFSCTNDDSCASADYGVTVSTSTGEFNGYAWSENIGWVSFNCQTGGDSQSDICAYSDYKVQDIRLKTSAIKIDITLEYNSEKQELMISKNNTFIFDLLSPEK